MVMVICRQVSKTYQQGQIGVVALDGIDMAIQEGEFAVLAGPSGSGKTTLLNLIGGLDHADSGQVMVCGRDYATMSPAQRAELRLFRIGFIFQAYNLIPVLTAAENVEYVMQLQGVAATERRTRARAILDEVGLTGKYDRRPAALSGGQQQRVAVARAIVSAPALVLADEPTANLDSRTGEGLIQLMRTLNVEKKITFVFSSHDRMVMDYARRRVHLKDGRIVRDRRA